MGLVTWLCRTCAGVSQGQTQPLQLMKDQGWELVDVSAAQGIISCAGIMDGRSSSAAPAWRRCLWRAGGKQLVCVSEQQPFSSIKRSECSSKGSQCNPLLGLPGAATLRCGRVKVIATVVMAPVVGRERCAGQSLAWWVPRVAADFKGCSPLTQQRIKAGFPALFPCWSPTLGVGLDDL